MSAVYNPDTFLITLYVTVDDFCVAHLSPEPSHLGPATSLSRSEVVTLSIFGQLAPFPSERAFYRFASRHLRAFFPRLPDRSQFNRLQMQHQSTTTQFALALARHLCSAEALGIPAYEVLDRCGVATRWCGRRGVGWLPECTDKGLCSRLGWFEGFQLLTCVTANGVISGWGFGPASCKDQPMAEGLLFARATQDSRLPSAGVSLSDGDYVTDKGFDGPRLHQRWQQLYQVHCFVCPPQRQRVDPGKHCRWPRAWYRLCASWRQIIETVHDKLINFCRLGRERPHDLSGFAARLCAKVALHNFCLFLNLPLSQLEERQTATGLCRSHRLVTRKNRSGTKQSTLTPNVKVAANRSGSAPPRTAVGPCQGQTPTLRCTAVGEGRLPERLAANSVDGAMARENNGAGGICHPPRLMS